MPEHSDEWLIRETLKGGGAAFGELVRRYEDRLFKTVQRLIGSVEEAQDVVQETFVTAYQSLASFKGDTQFFTWLYRIAYNTAVNRRRQNKTPLAIEPDKTLPREERDSRKGGIEPPE
jgi:RNA polymerase sigma-70 factor (ECF subfamily)